MKISVASGKGGVGKSMLASTLCLLFAQKKKVVAVDADVDAPNLHLWLGGVEKWDKVKKISVSERPKINFEKCTGCGKCVEICVFGALEKPVIANFSSRSNLEKPVIANFSSRSGSKRQKPVLNQFFCEGCGACEVVCPEKAIKMKKIKNAEIRIIKNIHGFPLVSAQLDPGETGSGKIVDRIKEKAGEFKHEIMILDAPAGTGCPVIAALNGVDFAVLVTEPTPSGFSDLKRVLTVVDHFKIPFGVVINKWDINLAESAKIEKWALRQAQGQLIGKISYDKRIFQAIAKLRPIMKTNLKAKKEIKEVYANLKEIL
jgi:MinD superfamily P-loop ATPase